MLKRQLQNEMAEFQRKLENNAFESRTRRAGAGKIDEERTGFTAIEQQAVTGTDRPTTKVSEQLRDSINSYLTEYNKVKSLN